MYKLIVDENIALAKEAFERFGSVTLMPGRDIKNKYLKDADALIVRSVTNVNSELLEGTKVKFVGTTTIGYDHIDRQYLNKKNIVFASAPGCNSYAVAEYVITGILELAVNYNFSLKDKSIAVIGLGNVGSKVAAFSEALGMKVMRNDPPLQRKGIKQNFISLDETYEADIITLHVPFNPEGIDKTFHLFNEENLNKLKDGALFINTSRGKVVDNKALSDLIKTKQLKVILDVWEDEPIIDKKLLKQVFICSPHIAGYSYEGKVNGTKMIYNALGDFLGTNSVWDFALPVVENNTILFESDNNFEKSLREICRKVYNINNDSENTKKMLGMYQEQIKNHFDWMRKNYPLRREFDNYSIKLTKENKEVSAILSGLRFRIIS